MKTIFLKSCVAVAFTQACFTKFEFQYHDGGEWKTIFSGAQIGEHFQTKFEPVTAREFRLNILDATEGPTFSEIELDGK